MNTLRVMLVQAQLLWKDPARNREHLEQLLCSADGDCELAVLPETFTAGFLGDTALSDEGMDGPTVAWMRALAARAAARWPAAPSSSSRAGVTTGCCS
jgi:predicted amidohydrolase